MLKNLGIKFFLLKVGFLPLLYESIQRRVIAALRDQEIILTNYAPALVVTNKIV
jgi:hypothetical protein